MSARRYREVLTQRYRALLAYLGLVFAVSGIAILSPLLALIVYPEELPLATGFVLAGGLLAATGGVLWWQCAPKRAANVTLQEGAIVVVLAWIVSILVGAVPLMTAEGLNFTQAVFEATSGWTTTGLSVVDVTQSSRLVLLYRSVMELVGGAGLAIVTLSAIAGPQGAGLSSAEGRSEQLVPHVRRSAKLVVGIYLGYILFGILALVLAGMGWFDAINHSFAALSTGGFSTRAESIGYWDSPAIEAVTNVLMILGGLNFITSYVLLTGRFKAVLNNGEVRLQAFLIPICAILIGAIATVGLYPTATKTVRVAIFETITALSTTGFSTVGYGNWASLGWAVMIGLMLIGGGTGSTAGGLKQYRIYALYRSLACDIKLMLMPEGTVSEPDVWQGDRRQFLSDRGVRQLGVFVFLYLLTFAIGTSILAAHGYPLSESLFEYASALGTVGLSIGITAADAPAAVLWSETVGMLLGRLEFFTVFVGCTRLVRDMSLMTVRA